MLLISFNIGGQLGSPEVLPRLRHSSVLASGMLMPKAPMDEDDPPSAHKHQIRGSGQISSMEPVSVTESMNEAPNGKLGLAVFAANPRHPLRALFRR
jgi:hypothetical protein